MTASEKCSNLIVRYKQVQPNYIVVYNTLNFILKPTTCIHTFVNSLNMVINLLLQCKQEETILPSTYSYVKITTTR